MEIINEIQYADNTYGCEVGISVAEWRDILSNGEVSTANYLNALMAFYKSEFSRKKYLNFLGLGARVGRTPSAACL
jgi:hypothetical protein